MANKCNTCGATVPDNATVCPYCGNAVTPTQPSNVIYTVEEDEPSTELNILSFLVPVAGWIMYFVFRDETPIKAKACSKWAWIGVAVSIGLSILMGACTALLDY